MFKKNYIGDMHGNTLKLLLTLKKTGYLVNLDDHYDDLNFYYKANSCQYFLELLNKLKFADKSDLPELCFIGDILADRGQNDLMTLALISKMHQNKVRFDIILSNHDLDFLKNIKSEQLKSNKEFYININNYRSPWQVKSMIKFVDTVNNNEYYRNLSYSYLNEYKEHLKVASIDIKKNGDVILATHAPLNKNRLKWLCSAMEDKTLPIIVHSLNSTKLDDLLSNRDIHKFVWERKTNPSFVIPTELNPSGKITHIFGHDMNASYKDMVCLDNEHGKVTFSVYEDELSKEIHEESNLLATSSYIEEILAFFSKNLHSPYDGENPQLYSIINVYKAANVDLNKHQNKALQIFYTLKHNTELHQAVYSVSKTHQLTADDWNKIKYNEQLQQAVYSLSKTNQFTTKDWDKIKNNGLLQQAVVERSTKEEYLKSQKALQKFRELKITNTKKEPAINFIQNSEEASKAYLMDNKEVFKSSIDESISNLETLKKHRHREWRVAVTVLLSLTGVGAIAGLIQAGIQKLRGKQPEYLFMGQATKSAQAANKFNLPEPS